MNTRSERTYTSQRRQASASLPLNVRLTPDARRRLEEIVEREGVYVPKAGDDA